MFLGKDCDLNMGLPVFDICARYACELLIFEKHGYTIFWGNGFLSYIPKWYKDHLNTTVFIAIISIMSNMDGTVALICYEQDND